MATDAPGSGAPFGGSSPSGEVPPGTVQMYWTPNMGCHIRVDLTTGVPPHKKYLESLSWVQRRALRTLGGGGNVLHRETGDRRWPCSVKAATIKLKLESVPQHEGQQDVTAYFPFGEMAVLVEGELAFLSRVRRYEFLCCCLGCLCKEDPLEVSRDIEEISKRRSRQNWAVKSSKALSGLLRHNQRLRPGTYMEASAEVSEAARRERLRGERLTLQRCQKFGCIFHASEKKKYDSMKENGLSLLATRQGWQKHRLAIHFVYAGGSESPSPGTVVRYCSNIFYAMDVGAFFNHGVVLSYNDIVLMYLTFHYRPPHEKDPAGLKHEQKQREAGVSSSYDEATPAAAAAAASSASAARSSAPGEAPASERNKMYAPYGDALVKTTPFNSLTTDTRKLLGVGFRMPPDEDPRDTMPKKDDPDYAAKLAVYNAFCFERDVYMEIKNIRTDFSTLVSAVSTAYGPDSFAYIQKHASDLDIRRKYKITAPEGYTVLDTSLRAHADLIAYENLKANRTRDIEELYSRPYEDFAVEEFLEYPESRSNIPKALLMKRLTTSAKATAEAEANNEKAFENIAGAKEKEGLVDTVEYKDFVRIHHLIERTSPLMKLADQQHGYGQTGLYHDGIRIDELGSFKVQHMGFFVKVLLHNHMKYNLAEEDLSDSMCKMAPIYSRRSTRPDVISGLAITGAHWMIATWQRRPEPARMPNPIGPAEDGPVPIYTSRMKYTALVLSLGSIAWCHCFWFATSSRTRTSSWWESYFWQRRQRRGKSYKGKDKGGKSSNGIGKH
ncbi:GIP [Symbiodinium microadriaticum]|nr:GIP [Symbiodinium microadriaticum]